MSKKKDSRADALAAIDARLESLRTRLAHAKYVKDTEKVESLMKKIERAMRQMLRLKRKR